MSVLGAYAYLTWTTARNRARRSLRQLRSPRYVVALLFAAAYFGFILLNPGQGSRGALAGPVVPELATLAALALIALVTWWWAIGSDASALAFTPAELQFLFPAPVTRRQLVQFKLVRAQLVILVNILIWSVLLRRGPGDDLLLLRPISLWVLFSTMQMHRLGATLARAAAAEHGGAGVRRSLPALAIVGLLTASVAWATVRAWPAGGLTIETARPLLRTLADAPALLPFHLAVAPVFATDARAWLLAIGPALALMLLHFAWVVRADAAFEDTAVAASAARARRAGSARRGTTDVTARRRGSGIRRLALRLPLRPTGDPAVAIVWKNAYAVVRGDRFARQLGFFGVVIVALCVVSWAYPAKSGMLLGIVSTWTAALPLLGPLWLRNDLRGDLPRLAQLRTYPIPATRMVLAQLASSAVALTLVELALGATLFIALLRSPDVTMAMGTRVALAIAVALALPAINLLSTAIHNAAALLFPAWMPLGADRKPGFEAMGQMYLTMFATLLLLGVLLVPPTIVGGIVAMPFVAAYGAWVAPLGVVAGSAVAIGELLLLVRWLGGVYERTEPSEVAA